MYTRTLIANPFWSLIFDELLSTSFILENRCCHNLLHACIFEFEIVLGTKQSKPSNVEETGGGEKEHRLR